MRELLQSLLDAEPLDGLVTDEQVLDRTTLLVAVRNAADAELTRTVRRAENMRAPERDGQKSMRSWLRGHLRLSSGAAHRIAVNGRALEQLPAVAAAFAAGAVTAEQVAVIAPVTAVDVQAEAVGQGVDLAEVDATLAEVAATRVHAQLGRLLTLSKHADGSLSIHGELDAVGGEKLCAVLDWRIPRCSAKGTTRRS